MEDKDISTPWKTFPVKTGFLYFSTDSSLLFDETKEVDVPGTPEQHEPQKKATYHPYPCFWKLFLPRNKRNRSLDILQKRG